jgi:hypothetical protein
MTKPGLLFPRIPDTQMDGNSSPSIHVLTGLPAGGCSGAFTGDKAKHADKV